jgi:hypothetical protein
VPPGPRGVHGEHAAERGRAGRRRIERQPLVARPQGRLERLERDPRLDGGGEIAGLVLDDAREAPEAHHEGAVPRRRAAGHLGPAAPRKHGTPAAAAARTTRATSSVEPGRTTPHGVRPSTT